MTPTKDFSRYWKVALMESDDSPSRLNSSQARHLLTSAQYADKLFGEIESVLFASKSKSPFRKYKDTLSPAQIKVVEDYLARIRAQLVRVLEAQGIPRPEPQLESVRSIRTDLAFVKIAFYDCTPERMRGYGQIVESKVLELNGLVDEMVSAIDKLNSYLAQGLGQDLEGRLQRLERSGGDVATLKTLERIINDHGLIEFRSTLSIIIDRMESKSFEIAFFGRVNSGKSSLLNSIVQSNILPVGVRPITAVPTRLMYGQAPRLTVWYANNNPEQLDVAKLSEFVTEERNPANLKHVSRIVVELPSPRLRDGIVLVDTPGLGSLATSGAAETLAYLPRCDHGVVLIDAGSTLTADDLSTIRTLYEAGVSVSAVLSKSDLLSPEDQAQAVAYVSEQITAKLKVELSVHPVSVRPTHAVLLEDWLKREILPLYERHQQLTQVSLQRKIGALREAVETALRIRLERAGTRSDSNETDVAGIDARLRSAVGRFAEARKICSDITHEIEDFAERGLAIASSHLVDKWLEGNGVSPTTVVRDTLFEIATARVSLVFGALEDLARDLTETLQDTARDLGFKDVHNEDDLISTLKEIPRLDLGTLEINVEPSFLIKLSKQMAARRIEQRLHEQIGTAVSKAFSGFGRRLDAWVGRILTDLQLRFDIHADGYRAHLDRLTAGGQVSEAEEISIRRDLEQLTRSPTGNAAEMTPVS
jgi:GTP-binding protein EngB required for normal cell division